MNRIRMHLLALLMASTATILFSCAPLRETISPHPLWVSAYYAGWMQGCGSAGHLRPEQIDYSAVTHIFHFAALPNSDGSIDCATKCLSPENSYALVNAAHAAGKKVLISVGGWLSETQFSGATNEVNRTRFITSLIDLMTSRGYDGIDIDWEPLSPSSIPQYSTFIVELRAALNKVRGHPVLTAAVKTQSSVFAKLQDNFDQINIMTYALSGPRPGWITWHNAPLYSGGYRFPLSGRSLPSADGMVEDFISAGIQREKLGIGIPFFGFVWSGGEGTPTAGATAPGQKWEKAPSAEEVPYYVIMDKYYHPDYYRWDEAAKVPYLSIDNAGSSRDKFISYDDETSCREKIKYVREKGLGGVMIFELGGGWRATSRSQDSLLKTVKKAVGDSSGAPAGKK